MFVNIYLTINIKYYMLFTKLLLIIMHNIYKRTGKTSRPQKKEPKSLLLRKIFSRKNSQKYLHILLKSDITNIMTKILRKDRLLWKATKDVIK